MRRILCYGDSNTWGYKPVVRCRYPSELRWTGILSTLLGPEYTVLECGANGRATVFDDPKVPYRNGKKGLGYALAENKQIDLIILSLGTNDLNYTDAAGSAAGVAELAEMLTHPAAYFDAGSSPIFSGEPTILILSPPHLGSDIAVRRPEIPLADKYGESLKLAPLYAAVAERYHAYFLDAAQYAQPSAEDCVHMLPPSHEALAHALAAHIPHVIWGTTGG